MPTSVPVCMLLPVQRGQSKQLTCREAGCRRKHPLSQSLLHHTFTSHGSQGITPCTQNWPEVEFWVLRRISPIFLLDFCHPAFVTFSMHMPLSLFISLICLSMHLPFYSLPLIPRFHSSLTHGLNTEKNVHFLPQRYTHARTVLPKRAHFHRVSSIGMFSERSSQDPPREWHMLPRRHSNLNIYMDKHSRACVYLHTFVVWASGLGEDEGQW